MKTSIWIALGTLLCAGASYALSPPPPLPRTDLEAFYLATDGDQWHRNDGWLDDDTPICDWYGISCRANPIWGFMEIARLELPANNLSGSLDEAVVQMIRRVQVSVDLSSNQLAGQLPASMPSHLGPSRLVLADNALSGPIPAGWAELALAWLDLSDNQLDGGAENAFAAMSTAAPGYLNLAGNQLSGSLSGDVMLASLYETDLPLTGGGLNICFNALDIADPVLIEWINERHVGGPGWEDCLGRERQALDAGISGSWFAPDRGGEGISMMLLDEQHFLIYSFGFDLDGHQAWSFDIGRHGEASLAAPELLETRGDFSLGLRTNNDEALLMRQLGAKRMDRVGDERLHVERVMIDYRGCPPLEYVPDISGPVPMPCPIFAVSDRLDYVQLSRLAGSQCDLTHPAQVLSGAWFNPDNLGEGFSVEIMADGSAVVYWYTYQADGSGRQTWMIGQAPVTSAAGAENDLLIPISSLLMPLGGRHGPEFDAADVQLVDWGELTLRFHAPDFDSGEVVWDSHFDDYGSGGYPIEPLARPALADCPNS